MPDSIAITFLISTYNRRTVLLHTLGKLAEIDRQLDHATEAIVVDNASTDGTADAVALQFPAVGLIRQKTNRGACARNIGLARAKGKHVIFLDDDSYPDADSVRKMINHFAADPYLAAAVFDVSLPDGSRECSAYPNVFIGCGTGFRREALEQVGGLPEDFFMQAEEYDLSLRLLDAGWEIRRFDDLHVTHLKTPGARQPARTTRLDVRNNLTLITRYFPREWVFPFAVDWMRRYYWIAKTKGRRHRFAFWRGLVEGLCRSVRPGQRRPISSAAFETFAKVAEIERRIREAASGGKISAVLLVDVGKNILPYWRAARASGVRIIAIADSRLAAPGRKYRGIPIIDDAAARLLDFDLAIIANVSPIHAALRQAELAAACHVPVLNLFGAPDLLKQAA